MQDSWANQSPAAPAAGAPFPARGAIAHLSFRDRFKPFRFPGRQLTNRAAVAILIALEPIPSLLMLQRCQRADDPWSGDMAFPGGRLAPTDTSTRCAALRELFEETGIDLDANANLDWTRLSDLLTRSHNHLFPMVVTPYVWILDARPDVHLNPESSGHLWIPLHHFCPTNRRRFWWQSRGSGWSARLKVPFPCFYYENRRIWGLSLRMIQELLSRALDRR